MKQPLDRKERIWFWIGITLLSASALWWLCVIISLAADPEGADVVILVHVLLTAIPVGIGIYGIRRGKRQQVKEAVNARGGIYLEFGVCDISGDAIHICRTGIAGSFYLLDRGKQAMKVPSKLLGITWKKQEIPFSLIKRARVRHHLEYIPGRDAMDFGTTFTPAAPARFHESYRIVIELTSGSELRIGQAWFFYTESEAASSASEVAHTKNKCDIVADAINRLIGHENLT